MGVATTIFDTVYNYQEWQSPTSAFVSILTTLNIPLLRNFVPVSREVEPPILSLASVSLVGIFSYYIFLHLLGAYDYEPGEHDSHSLAIRISLWYAILLCAIMVNNTLVNRQAHEAHPTNADPDTKDHLLVSLRFTVLTRGMIWQLLNSQVFMVLASAYMSASSFGESWPLPINTTIASLLMFVAVVGFQLQSLEEVLGSANERSLPHLVVLAVCAMITTIAVVLNHVRIVDRGHDWDFGTIVALILH